MTIAGTGFTGTTAVTFNAVAASTFMVDSDIQITATVPVGATTGPIAVTNPDGTATSTDEFTVIVAPSISGFTPKRGHVNTLVTITGTGFTGVTSVRFNGRAATFNVIDDTEIRARVPSAAGTGPIRVQNDAGSDLSNTNFGFRRIPHGVAITMRLDGHLRAIGEIRVRNASLSIRRMCGGGRRVLIQRFRDGRFRTVAQGGTQRDGDYRIGLRDREGRYRAFVGGKISPNHRCRPDVSRAKSHDHPNPPPDGGGGGGGGGGCTPGYSPCLPLGPSDYDCAGGSGNGPAYTEPGVVYQVSGSDPYGLDADNDGRGCE